MNNSSLKDAIVIFGGGCTGEIVSPDGLLFTNHHCGYGSIQSLSSVEHDYLKNGFWAMSRAEELPAPGLKVRFIRRIVDVTPDVLGAVLRHRRRRGAGRAGRRTGEGRFGTPRRGESRYGCRDQVLFGATSISPS